MWRKQIAVVFWALLVWSMYVASVRADGLAFDESLIGYDDRGVQQSKDNAQPCQSCPPATACQSCTSDAACPCNASDVAHSGAAAPMILTIGPPPRLYSPSSDFGKRIEQAPASWTVVGDDNTATNAQPTPAPSTWTCPTSGRCLPTTVPVACGCYETVPPPGFAAAYPASSLPVPVAKGVASFGYPVFTPDACMSPAAGLVPAAGEGSRPMVPEAERMDHMLQAVYHLEAAGLPAEADRLRGECDAQMHDVVNRLKTAEAELARLQKTVGPETATACANHPQKPVVTVAMRAGNGEENKYPVQQAGYISPSETLDRPDESFDQRPLPAPFVPQPIMIEPTNIFGTPGEYWGIKPIPDLNSPFMFDGYIFTPDKH